jgi:hypothetical protein
MGLTLRDERSAPVADGQTGAQAYIGGKKCDITPHKRFRAPRITTESLRWRWLRATANLYDRHISLSNYLVRDDCDAGAS